ncbi:superoxide dismutase [Gammaproteobacteria bacterium]|nr:superoxide dismutase [Gammaproteobacteria bacterium]
MFTLPKLPYPRNALEPYISSDTVDYHYGKHHQTYVDKLNALLEKDETRSLIEIIQSSDGKIFNNAAQVWNHTFYWESLSKTHHQAPLEKMENMLSETFGNYDKFITQFSEQAANLFGSGWVWLVIDEKQTLSIISTANAQTPITMGLTPLLTCDVWEHAYYLDTQNARPKYINNFWNIINWVVVEKRLIQHLESL